MATVRFISAAVLAVTTTQTFAPAVRADASGFHAGVSLGLGNSVELCKGRPYDLGCNDTALAGKAFVGYRANRFGQS